MRGDLLQNISIWRTLYPKTNKLCSTSLNARKKPVTYKFLPMMTKSRKTSGKWVKPYACSEKDPPKEEIDCENYSRGITLTTHTVINNMSDFYFGDNDKTVNNFQTVLESEKKLLLKDRKKKKRNDNRLRIRIQHGTTKDHHHY